MDEEDFEDLRRDN